MKSVDLELCYMTATEAIDRFKSKDLSPVELIDQLIARIESTNPSLNAFTYTFFDRARNQACLLYTSAAADE